MTDEEWAAIERPYRRAIKERIMLTTREAAILLGVQPRTVNQYIFRGQLHAEKHGRDLFITHAELDRFQRERPRLGWPKGKPRKEQRT